MAAYTKVFYISIWFWLILCVECYSDWSYHVLTIKPGGSVTIPCHYNETNPPQKKFWYSDIDKSKIYTNTSEENLSVIDHPDQSLFTVTMRNLQKKHTGDYSCVVETDGLSTIRYDLHLRVQFAPDVSVVSSSVSGHEGGNVRVQCFYSSRYQNELKQWCRYKDQSCYTVGRTDTSQNSSVQISDDGRSSFTVLMTGLRLSDSGWFFCSAREVMNPVQLTVIEAEPAPDVSVVSSSVSGHEGGNVRVQCFYSSRYQNHPLQWCRYKDESCYTVGRTDTSQSSSVQISDDVGRRSFTVLMTGLRLSDSGWFFCSAGEALNPVHLTVIEDKRRNKELLTVWLPVSAALLLLLILVGVFFTWRWKQRSKQDKHQIIEKNDSRTIDPIYYEPEDPVIYNTINDECSNDPIKDKTYSTISDAHVNAAPPAGALMYSLVGPH
ncbi:polymeric immunoglobulin receptor-like isoform X2 [Chanodichthys erythropterus]|uniref:polymeric immunoglobulin receptor-like isoform X2 n=1 Tax=Chanodichthys erythropterus TaxID=933992 RepID=UPI00351E8FE7